MFLRVYVWVVILSIIAALILFASSVKKVAAETIINSDISYSFG